MFLALALSALYLALACHHHNLCNSCHRNGTLRLIFDTAGATHVASFTEVLLASAYLLGAFFTRSDRQGSHGFPHWGSEGCESQQPAEKKQLTRHIPQ